MTVRIRALSPADWVDVRRIYLEGIHTGDATFETEAPSWEVWHAKMCPTPRLVLEMDDEITGWAALSPYSTRPVYRGVAEVSIYVGSRFRGRGQGGALMSALVSQSEEAGFWTLQAGIFPENQASVALHQKYGFVIVGRRERLGQLAGVWRDVLLMERRSPTIGWDES